VLFGP